MKNKVITVRTTEQQHRELDNLARHYRKQTGEAWRIADLVRAAIDEKLRREAPEGDAHTQLDAFSMLPDEQM